MGVSAPVNISDAQRRQFSSTLFHRSGPNLTDHHRRVYLAVYSAEPIMARDGSAPLYFADPFLSGGNRVDQ